MENPVLNRNGLLRRRLLRGAVLGGSALGLGGCRILDGLREENAVRDVIAGANGLTYRAQRLLAGGQRLAPEFSLADIRQGQHPNGSTAPDDEEYLTLARNGFADYSLTVTGAVERPLTLSRDHLLALPARSQITRHDCVEGWSCIAKWTGVQLARVLEAVRPTSAARFAVFYCYDTLERGLSGPVKYYESIDLIDAMHPQTILAYGMNGRPLPVENGAPLRLRVERQLGYKMAKYIHTIELVPSFAAIDGGHGSYWADRGYDWYAGI